MISRGERGRDAAAFLDEEFLAVADQPTVTQATCPPAMTARSADSANLQLYVR